VTFLTELFDLARSDLSDREVAEALSSTVEANPKEALVALERLRTVCDNTDPAYDTDRAYRVLEALVGRTSPKPAPSEHAPLFERERELAQMPQEQAFAKLVAAVPELDAIRTRANQLADSPESFGIRTQSTLVSVPRDLLPNTNRLVGPSSAHPDPLVRSRVAASVVSNYVAARTTGTTHLALWDANAPMRSGSLTGTLNPNPS
jgi:hypothetical protein